MADTSELAALRGAVYDLRRSASALQEAASRTTDPAQLETLLQEAGRGRDGAGKSRG
jgi:hypothetical protein